MTRIVIRIGALLCVVGLVGCAAKFEKKVDSLERSMDDIRVVQAELSARLDALENQARQVTGKVQELEYSQNYQIGGTVGTLKQEISRLGKRIPPPALVPLLALEEDETRASAYSAEEARFFKNGLTRIRTGTYHEALPIFQELLTMTRSQDLAGRALFWVGIAEEGKGNNPAALKVYHQFSQSYPTHPRLPLALLRQASVFVRLRDIQTAKLTLQKLIAQFPKSPEAQDAKAKLAKLR